MLHLEIGQSSARAPCLCCQLLLKTLIADEELFLDVSGVCVNEGGQKTNKETNKEEIIGVSLWFEPPAFTASLWQDRGRKIYGKVLYFYCSNNTVEGGSLFSYDSWQVVIIAPSGTVKCTPFGSVAVMWSLCLRLKRPPWKTHTWDLWHVMWWNKSFRITAKCILWIYFILDLLKCLSPFLTEKI